MKISDEDWERALNSAARQLEIHARGGELATPAQRRKALDDAMQHGVGILQATHLRKTDAAALLDAGYDNGFGVTSLDTLLSEEMDRDARLDFATFLIATLSTEAAPTPPPPGARHG